jgi:hypothetical protein
MENENIVTLQFKLTRDKALLLLALFFLCWHPRPLGSETLTLTTYYPAPYGGYVSLLTTSDTVLSRDAGYVRVGAGYSALLGRRNANVKLEVGSGNISTPNMVNWGTARGTLSSDQGSSIELGGVGSPYIDFSQNMAQDFSARIMLASAGTLRVSGNLSLTASPALVNSGSITGVCRTVAYFYGGVTSCGPNERVMTWYANPAFASQQCGMLFKGGRLEVAANWTPQVCIGADRSGRMLCCRITG